MDGFGRRLLARLVADHGRLLWLLGSLPGVPRLALDAVDFLELQIACSVKIPDRRLKCHSWRIESAGRPETVACRNASVSLADVGLGPTLDMLQRCNTPAAVENDELFVGRRGQQRESYARRRLSRKSLAGIWDKRKNARSSISRRRALTGLWRPIRYRIG